MTLFYLAYKSTTPLVSNKGIISICFISVEMELIEDHSHIFTFYGKIQLLFSI